MLVNKSFLRDFARLANFYGWDGQVLEEVKEQTRNSAELRAYWVVLAEAHRSGYRQNKKNNFERLACWRKQNEPI